MQTMTVLTKRAQAIFIVLVMLLIMMCLVASRTVGSSAFTSSPKASAGHAASYPDFQLLYVNETIAGIKPKPLGISESDNYSPDTEDSEKWKLKLVHRDKLPVNRAVRDSNNHKSQFLQRMDRDVKRVAAIVRRLKNMIGEQDGTTTSPARDDNASYQEEAFGSDVVSGMDQGSGEYFVRIGVGSPPRNQYVVIDSGSDIVWVQCQPCNQCYRQMDPVFDPAASASYSGVSCSSSICSRLDNGGCQAGRCRYEVSYGDGSYTKGTLALETLTFGRTVIQNVAIGCGHRNQGMFVGAAGLLGLGAGSMSLVGQLGGQTGGAFSYCLVSRGSDSTGSLEFGREAMPVGAAWIPLIRNSRAPSFYYIGLSGLGIGGIRVAIPENVFHLTDLGYGGVVMDTGTAVTRVPAIAYKAFRDAFLSQTTNLPRASSVSIFDTCYNLNGFVSVRVPTVSLYFSDGPILTLPARNFLIPVDDVGTFCLAFAASASDLSIIGNIQQEGIQVSLDGANGFVGFGPNVC